MEAYHHKYIGAPAPSPAPPPPYRPPPEPNLYAQPLPPPYLPPNPWYPNHYQFPPPPPPPPPQSQFAAWPPPPPSFPPYLPPFQERPIPNWANPQPLDHSERHQPNAEDWAAKAREWAAAKKVEDPPTHYRPPPLNAAFNPPEVPNSYSSLAGNYPAHPQGVAVRPPNQPVLHETNNPPPFPNFRPSDRPKKAPVPNWLKEEIIKNASTITKSSVATNEGEIKDTRSSGSVDEDDVKEEDQEDEDEDEEEAARSASINLQIKRILTEVLLKVTDEVFDEIATKVLEEDEEAKIMPKDPSHTVVNAKSEASGPSVLGRPGDLLGLANYGSDEDDDEENDSNEKPESKEVKKEQEHEGNGKVKEIDKPKRDRESEETRKRKTKHYEEERNRYRKRRSRSRSRSRSPSDSDGSSDHSKRGGSRKRYSSPTLVRSKGRHSSYSSSSGRKGKSRSPSRRHR